MQFHKDILRPISLSLLQSISTHKDFQEFYLVGGTSLALQLGHRESIDLDFFSQNEFSSNLINALNKEYTAISVNRNSIEVICDETKLFFFFFAFPRFKPLINFQGVRMADPIDIGLMKLLALQGRTTKKDIIDLYFIDKEIIPLEKLLDIFQDFYPKERFNSLDTFKNLLDNHRLDDQPLPLMLKDFDWESGKNYVVKKIINHLVKVLMV